MNASEYWEQFLAQHPELRHIATPASYYYGDNKTVANDCAELVVRKIKKATTSSLWWFQKNNEPLPPTRESGHCDQLGRGRQGNSKNHQG